MMWWKIDNGFGRRNISKGMDSFHLSRRFVGGEGKRRLLGKLFDQIVFGKINLFSGGLMSASNLID